MLQEGCTEDVLGSGCRWRLLPTGGCEVGEMQAGGDFTQGSEGATGPEPTEMRDCISHVGSLLLHL